MIIGIAVNRLQDQPLLCAFKETVSSSGLTMSPLSCHGNPVHPNQAPAAEYFMDICNAIRLAADLRMDTITCFSGCAGDGLGVRFPNWVLFLSR